MKDLLFEIGCEEIPASYIDPALAWLNEVAQKELTAARLTFGSVSTHGTPRRLVLIVRDVAETQQDLSYEVLGPRAEAAFDASGNLTAPAKGFLAAKKIDLEKAYKKQTPKGEVLAALAFEAGRSATSVLAELLPKFMLEMPFPKTMRWESSGATFARPVRWIVAMLGSEVVNFKFADVTSGTTTRGHRFLAPELEVVKSVDSYLELMPKKFVMLSSDERKTVIKSEAERLAKEQGGRLVEDDALLDTVKNLVEYPWPLMGQFESRYLDIPKEILICEMREHQKYFAVADAQDNLLACFIVVAGSKPEDASAVVEGHGRVLRARFEDGSFYYYEDLKTPLEAFVAKLERVQFQRELGSVFEKAERIESVGVKIATLLGADKAAVSKSAQLCKADLVSGVVAQFPELQGVMGSYYATKAGESKAVVQAIREHYWPRFAGDALPGTDVGCVISLVDKLDTLCGVIGIGKAPKGNADPFALRRAGIGIARIIIERGWRLLLTDLVKLSIESYDTKLKAANVDEIVAFIVGRARGVFTAPTTLLDGAMAAGSNDLADLAARIDALSLVHKEDAETFAKLAAGLKRAGNIVAKAVADKQFDASSRPDLSVLQHTSEKQLLAEIEKVQKNLDRTRGSKSELREIYISVMKDIAKLKPFIDRFFDDVMVMVDDVALRSARLALLQRLQNAASVVADFTRVQL